LTKNFKHAIKELDFFFNVYPREGRMEDFISVITPHAIVWLIGARNVVKIEQGEFRIMSESASVWVQHKETGKVMEARTFSNGEHKYPNSVKVRMHWFFSKWIPMGELTIPLGEIPEDSLFETGDEITPNGVPAGSIANLARFVS